MDAEKLVQLFEKQRNSIGGKSQRQESHLPPFVEVIGFVAESGCILSVQFSREFIQPDVECGALLGGQPREHHAHAEAGVRVDDRPAEVASTATIANAEAHVRIFGKRVDGIDVAAARA